MPKKQTKKPEYPQELFVYRGGEHRVYVCESADDVDRGFDTVAIYKFDRMAKVKRTVTVE